MSVFSLHTHTQTLADRLWPAASATGRRAKHVALVLLGSLLLAASAQVSIPIGPVPITGQTFAVLVIGMAYGARLGMATVLAYLFEGAAGLPFFAGGSGGLAPFIGPTGGYLIGFLLAAGVIGWLAEHGWDRNPLSTAAAMFVGNVVLYVPGLLWLAKFMHFDVHATLAAGLFPFLLGDSLKLLLAAATMPLAWRFLDRR